VSSGTLSRYTPVAIERVRKLLGIKGIVARRCAKECVTAWKYLVCMYVIRRKGVSMRGKVEENCGEVLCVNEEGRFGSRSGTGATMEKGSVGLVQK